GQLQIRGKVVYQPGPWGSDVPCTHCTVTIFDKDAPGKKDDIIWTGKPDENGEFAGLTADWQDKLELTIGDTTRTIVDPSDTMLLRALIVNDAGEGRTVLPFNYVGEDQMSPALVVPWGPAK
ncbi:MAG TPA: hypothetical protein VNT75_00680, partial [Symbiobacteriaceae bacterium]|nr:hypothetical protein [Symbiobacteriaceae bacterium]